MKKFKNSRTVKTIISSAVAVMMAASAAVSLCCSTVCAYSSPFADLSGITAITDTVNHFVIKSENGTTYEIDKSRGSGVPLNFIGADGYHYYIDNKCIAVAGVTSGGIYVFDRSIWDNGNTLTEIAGVPLKDIIHFEGSSDGYTGYVSDIKTCYEDGWFYDYTMHLHGKAGPFALTYQYWMDFYDEEGDMYTLRFLSESYKEHTVNYNSSAYRFYKIEWYCT